MSFERRQFLALAGTTATVGCLSAPAKDDSDGMHLESIDAAGSPGKSLPLVLPGNVTVLEFFATWCGYCPGQMPPLKKIRDKYPSDEVAVHSVTAEMNEKTVEDYWEKWDATWPALLDDELDAYEKYSVEKLPTTFVIDSEGSVVKKHVRTVFEDELTTAIENAKGGPNGTAQ